MPLQGDGPITCEGRNLWRRCRSQRAAVLVDAEAYYEALMQACEKAQRSIVIVGWDLDSRVRLRPGVADRTSSELAPFLDALVRRRPALEVHLLGWDYSLLYALEREMLPSVGFGWRTHERVHFALDDAHPMGASHHQKIAVIDDAVAFAGGIDLCNNRWDTPAHAPDEPRRVDLTGKVYGPFHDVQMVVDGDTAAALGALVRERWRRATGRTIDAPARTDAACWPDGVTPDFEDVEVGIARTEPACDGRAAVREIRALTDDCLRAARRSLYVENQYLTAQLARDLLSELLGRAEGAEMLLVAPSVAAGWLEENTMSVLRAQVVQHLRASDAHGRLRVVCPVVPALGPHCLNVHAKVMVVDDRILRVGSANLTNRSMALDTECDLVIEARNARESEAIARVRWRLLGEHLAADPEALAESARELGSLFAVIDRHQGTERTLKALTVDTTEAPAEVLANAAIVDPDRPIDPDMVLETFLPDEHRKRSRRRVALVASLMALALTIGALWAFTPLRSLLDPRAFAHAVEPLRQSVWAVPAVLALFVIGSLVAFPVTLLVLQCAWVLGPVKGTLCALAGALLSASVNYGLGRLLGRGRVRRFTGKRLAWLIERLRRRGALSVALVRTFPVAPFGVVNVLCGAARIRFGSFMLGTALGMTPGIIALNLFGVSLAALLRRPDASSAAVALGAAVVFLGVGALFSRWLKRRDGGDETPEPAP